MLIFGPLICKYAPQTSMSVNSNQQMFSAVFYYVIIIYQIQL
jgi:hypothetical protein